MTRLTDNIDEVCTRIEIKLAADVLITSRRGWHVTVITFKVSPSDKLLNWLMPSVTTWQVVETAKNLFLSPTFSATPATFSRGRAGLILGAKQSFCQSRQKLYFARPAFFLKVQCHLFAGISLEQMGRGRPTTVILSSVLKMAKVVQANLVHINWNSSTKAFMNFFFGIIKI